MTNSTQSRLARDANVAPLGGYAAGARRPASAWRADARK